ncbi:hypothetical protein EQM06_06465 [Aminipila luticellarii]|uniref:Catalase immune-responsive domain-containing protein n=2 Tax=Aminipila luticellarii TaxID=2507160 RepID=A0A410PVF2_9FIRM|nr:hypothetical protein EQM06_06465 [Aminipila luticellarii]
MRNGETGGGRNMELVYQQANDSLKAFSTADKEALVYNLVESLMFISDEVQEKVVECLKFVNEELGDTIQRQL